MSIIFVLLLNCFPAYAEIYQYFDKEGTLIVTDNPFGTKKSPPSRNASNKTPELAYRNDTEYIFYNVYGKSLHDLMLSIQINGPFSAAKSKRFSGQTDWRIGWSYSFDSTYRIEDQYVYVSVNIHDVEFFQNVTVTLPALSESSHLETDDFRQWEEYLKKLLEHEHDHVRIVLDSSMRNDAVNRLLSIKTLKLPLNPGMNAEAMIRSAVEKETQKAGHDYIITIKSENEAYDAITEHGLRHEMRNIFWRI